MCLQKASNTQSLLCPSKSFASYNVSIDLLKAYSQMADRRKLQGEIDRCLKKVTEGVEIFEDLWQKVQSATNCNTKEKHEADLKKEIKKLQRLRDGIKTWLAGSEIKDKKPLLEYKKLIEVQMERFKIIERETKTKAYSKEGLGTATKVDPKEKEKEDITNWLSHSIDELNVQIDQFESEIETVVARKKKLDRDKQDQVDVYRSYLERHRFHIDKLETIMRLVDNDALQLGQIASIKDDVEHYIKSSRDPDFKENEFLYEDLKLDEACAALGSKLAAMSVHDNDDHGSNVSDISLQNSSSPSPSPSLAAHSKDTPEEENRTRIRSQSEDMNHCSRSINSSLMKQTSLVCSNSSSTGSGSSTICGSQNSGGGKATHVSSAWQTSSSFSSSSPDTPVAAAAITPTTVQNYAQVASANHMGINSTSDKASFRSATDRSRTPTTPVATSHGGTGTSTPNLLAKSLVVSFGTPLKLSTSATLTPPSTLSQQQQPFSVTASDASLLTDTVTQSVSNQFSPQPPQQTNSSSQQHSFLNQQQQLQQQQQQQQKSSAPASRTADTKSCVNGPFGAGPSLLQIATGSDVLLGASKNSSQFTAPSDTSPLTLSSQSPLLVNVNLSRGGVPSYSSMSSPRLFQQASTSLQTSFQLSAGRAQTPATTTIRLDSILGVAPLGPQPLDRQHALQLMMLEAASHHLPLPMDSQRVRMYLPSSPYPMPPYYTHLHPSVADSPEFFQRLQPETLFFIFYYMEGTKAQHMAAKALKQLSWRFHTKFMMWFQRHEEPKVITEDFEQGTYIYFDYEKWMQRKKEGFVFEYKYLEDLN